MGISAPFGTFTYYSVSSGNSPWLCSADGTGITFSVWPEAKIYFCSSGGTITNTSVTGSDIQQPIKGSDGNYYWGRRADQKIGKLSGSTYSTFVDSIGEATRHCCEKSSYIYAVCNTKIIRGAM